jgi:hypothetical protein
MLYCMWRAPHPLAALFETWPGHHHHHHVTNQAIASMPSTLARSTLMRAVACLSQPDLCENRQHSACEAIRIDVAYDSSKAVKHATNVSRCALHNLAPPW